MCKGVRSEHLVDQGCRSESQRRSGEEVLDLSTQQFFGGQQLIHRAGKVNAAASAFQTPAGGGRGGGGGGAGPRAAFVPPPVTQKLTRLMGAISGFSGL